MQQKLADVATVAEESIVGVHVVKSFAQEDRRQHSSRVRSGAVFDADACARTGSARIYVPLLSFLPLLAQAAVLLAARPDGRARRSLSLERVLHLQPAASRCSIVPLRMLGMWIGQAQRATASGERIFEILDEPEEVDDRAGAVDAAARRRARSASSGVTFGYDRRTDPSSTTSTSRSRPGGRSR